MSRAKSFKFLVAFLSFFTLDPVFTLKNNSNNNECGQSHESVEEEAYKFLRYLRPLRYQVYVDPCISDGNFSGYVQMDILILESTENLTLHSQNLEYCEEGVFLSFKGTSNDAFEISKPGDTARTEFNASSDQETSDSMANAADTIKPSGFVYHSKSQTITMKFEESLKPGRYLLEMNYMGVINLEPAGLYRKSYNDPDGIRKTILLTNTFPISARRIFPCLDVPSVKAEIYFTMQTSMNYTTIGINVPDTNVEFKEGQRWTHFHLPGNHSVHSLVLAVLEDFNNLTTSYVNKNFITYATSSDLKWLKVMQETYMKALEEIETLTNVRYPISSITNIVIPEKVDGKSTAGLGVVITKGDHALLENDYGPLKKKDVVFQAVRDVASQWFNHLITPKSWKYMWLTEGITEYVKYYVTNKLMPEWGLQEKFVVWELQRRSFIPNKLVDGPPLNANVSDHPKDTKCLLTRSISTWSKAASIIRMMSHFLSESIVHEGISNLLRAKLHDSVEPDDFLKAVQKAINESNDRRVENANITEIMQTWLNAGFYPVLNVTRNYSSGAMHIKQIPVTKIFEMTDKQNNDKWWIPITYAVESRPNFNRTCPTDWLKPEMELVVDGVDPKDWIIFNIQQTGYYRVLYDEENWKRLAFYLNSPDYYRIAPINRAQIINDAVQFSLKGHLNTSVFLKLVSYLRQETNYIPWYDAQFIFSFLNYHLSNTRSYETFRQFSLNLLIPLVDKIGYEDRPKDDFSTLLLRRISNHWACYFGHQNCWKNATMQLEALLNNKKLHLGSTDLQEWTQCVGLYGATEATWYKMFKKYKHNFSEEILLYLACTENLEILNSFLSMTVANNSVIPKRQVLTVFKSVCLYPSGNDKRLNLCLNFMNENFDKVKYRLEKAEEALTYFFDLLASEIRQEPQLEKFMNLLTQERCRFALTKLDSRLKQMETRVKVYEQKADFYEPYFKEILSQV